MAVRYFVYISKSIRKSLLRVPSPWSERIEKAIDMLETDPFYGEKMTGKLKDKRKIRIWPYRIIYETDFKKKIIIIVEIGHRGSISYD
jgi:addiction module RelE/StbE family toxin